MLLIAVIPLLITLSQAALDCEFNFVCDPGRGTDINVISFDLPSAEDCEFFCHQWEVTGISRGCKFFTYSEYVNPLEYNCNFMTACHQHMRPHPGMVSGAYDCEDENLFCPHALGIPEYDRRTSFWQCDHGVVAYGNTSHNYIPQGIECFTTCPSYKYQNDLTSAGQIVVSSTCEAAENRQLKTAWSRAIPKDVVDTRNVIISTLDATPLPHCGCEPLNFEGVPEFEDGKVFHCDSPHIDADGNLSIDEENSCQLFCDGVLMWHLFCSRGYWSVQLEGIQDIYCYESPSTTPATTAPATTTPATTAPTTTTPTAVPTASTAPPTPTACPLNWFAFEDFGCLHIPKTTESADWFSASEYCTANGGHLVEIETEDQEDQLTLLALTLSVSSFWIGLSDLGREGDWAWSYSGSPLHEDMIDFWSDGRPNDSCSNHDDCVLFERENSLFKWFDTDCLSTNYNGKMISQVCQCLPGECGNEETSTFTTGSTTITTLTPSSAFTTLSTSMSSTFTSLNTSSATTASTTTISTALSSSTMHTTSITTTNQPTTPYTCPSNGDLLGDYCYVLIENKSSWKEAEDHCQESGGHLTSVHSEEENSFLGDNVVMWDNVWVGGHGGTAGWEWVDGSEWDWSEWASGQPGGGEGCVYYSYSKMKWYSYSCGYKFYYTCKYRI